MIRTYIVEYVPIFLIVLIGIFSMIKLLAISVYGLRENPMKLFLDSHKIYSRQVIKNTFYKKLQQYYSFSNNINKVYYGTLTGMLMAYILLQL